VLVKNWTLFLPSSLAKYIAMSACFITD